MKFNSELEIAKIIKVRHRRLLSRTLLQKRILERSVKSLMQFKKPIFVFFSSKCRFLCYRFIFNFEHDRSKLISGKGKKNELGNRQGK